MTKYVDFLRLPHGTWYKTENCSELRTLRNKQNCRFPLFWVFLAAKSQGPLLLRSKISKTSDTVAERKHLDKAYLDGMTVQERWIRKHFRWKVKRLYLLNTCILFLKLSSRLTRNSPPTHTHVRTRARAQTHNSSLRLCQNKSSQSKINFISKDTDMVFSIPLASFENA